MPDHPSYKISCHCGLASQIIHRPSPSPSTSGPTSKPPRDLNLCHCKPCRKNTGLLCVSYMRIEPPEHTNGLVAYRPTHSFERFFCETCGCHVFWRGQGMEADVAWAVATGTIEGSVDGSGAGAGGSLEGDDGSLPEPAYARHINVLGTRDGGLSVYLPEIHGLTMDDRSRWGDEQDAVTPDVPRGIGHADVLPASCHCGGVSFHVTRPDGSSSLPTRGYPDLTHPYCSTAPDLVANPEGERWWLRLPASGPSPPQALARDLVTPTRYLAGTCACRSCRLTSGFEIQSWAFVPRSNIFFFSDVPLPEIDPDLDLETTRTVKPLDFNTLRPGDLQSYHSSPGVVREFCGKCGATVFWHDELDAKVVDISAGLFDAVEGARAVGWLDWWTGRVSFSEETRTGRRGAVADRAESLIQSLERGLKGL